MQCFRSRGERKNIYSFCHLAQVKWLLVASEKSEYTISNMSFNVALLLKPNTWTSCEDIPHWSVVGLTQYRSFIKDNLGIGYHRGQKGNKVGMYYGGNEKSKTEMGWVPDKNRRRAKDRVCKTLLKEKDWWRETASEMEGLKKKIGVAEDDAMDRDKHIWTTLSMRVTS